METAEHRCKGCGIVFKDDDTNIDKCAKKRLYCEMCLAQKNPRSRTEQKIKKKYTLVTALSAFLVLGVIVALNWERNKNDNIFEYAVALGLAYVIIWIITSVLFIPVLMRMKKPYKEEIKKEKEEYIATIEEKKVSRKSC